MARVLILEDNADLRDLWGEVLRAAGHTVSLAGTEAEAVAHGLEHDVFLVDIHLGSTHRLGTHYADEVRARLPNVPIVLLTGWTHLEKARQSYPVLVKPVDPEALIRLVGAKGNGDDTGRYRQRKKD